MAILKAVEQSGRIGMSEFETYEMGMATDYDKDQKEIEELMLRLPPSYMQDPLSRYLRSA